MSQADQTSCNHEVFKVVAPFFLKPEQARCVSCGELMPLMDALSHVRPLRDAHMLNPSGEKVWPEITISYPMAMFGEPNSHTGYAIPDLGVDVLIEQDPHEAFEACNYFIFESLDECNGMGHYPPSPRSLDDVKREFPQYAEWEWRQQVIDVTDYVEPYPK